MKKTYIAPEVEIKRFNTEDIMSESAISFESSSSDAYNSANVKGTVSYNTLFNL